MAGVAAALVGGGGGGGVLQVPPPRSPPRGGFRASPHIAGQAIVAAAAFRCGVLVVGMTVFRVDGHSSMHTPPLLSPFSIFAVG
jgi:hypothetical protein